MAKYTVTMESDDENQNIASITCRVTPETYAALSDFLMGRISLQIAPAQPPRAEEASEEAPEECD